MTTLQYKRGDLFRMDACLDAASGRRRTHAEKQRDRGHETVPEGRQGVPRAGVAAHRGGARGDCGRLPHLQR